MKSSILNGIQFFAGFIIGSIIIFIIGFLMMIEFHNEKKSDYTMTCIYSHSYASAVNYIFRDNNTGVLYTAISHGGITPMIDANGNIIIDKNFTRGDD